MSKPLNYARWDNIDVDADIDDEPKHTRASESHTARPTDKHSTKPASGSSPAQTVTQGRPDTESARTMQVQAIKIYCEKDKAAHPGAPWVPTTIPGDHPVFAETPLPVSARLGIPLVMRREGTVSRDRADLDCQMATYLAIDDRTAFAPPRWQASVGTVLVARLDRKPLSSQHLEGFWMYNDAILDAMGDSATGLIDARRWLGRAQFQRWWRAYVRERHENGIVFAQANGWPLPAPGSADDFSNPGSPYDL